MPRYVEYIILYLFLVNIVALTVTVYDKIAAIRGKWRISEKALLIISALGGWVLMYPTMLLIRHKTRKKKFMIGLPAIMVAEIFLFFAFMYLRGIL
ncbi:MAG: DUF1294 domain-containing protein [Ruminococcus sp.]